MLAGEDSAFKDSLAALLDLFKEFGEGTGTMFVVAAPCSEPPNRLIPATVNGRPDLVREHDDPANRYVLVPPSYTLMCMWQHVPTFSLCTTLLPSGGNPLPSTFRRQDCSSEWLSDFQCVLTGQASASILLRSTSLTLFSGAYFQL